MSGANSIIGANKFLSYHTLTEMRSSIVPISQFSIDRRKYN